MAAFPLEQEIDYPESDGKPLAESDPHRDEILNLIYALRRHYQETPDVYVSGNLLLYYVKGDVRKCISPDVFLVQGVSKKSRRSYKVWEEGKAPSFVIEVTSESTHQEDLVEKPGKYARLGVAEYFLFDPCDEYLSPRLQGFRLTAGRYRPIRPARDGSLTSRATGLQLQIEGDKLRLVDLASGERLRWMDEEADAREAAEARARDAEEEIARLRRELAELRKS
jgi:Uma2 family endonuclease